MPLIQSIKKTVCTFDYGVKCHGYSRDGTHEHLYRCRDLDCPRRLADNEYYNKTIQGYDFIELGRRARYLDTLTAQEQQSRK